MILKMKYKHDFIKKHHDYYTSLKVPYSKSISSKTVKKMYENNYKFGEDYIS